MLFSFKELKRLANLPESIKLEDVTKAINSIGFEVEETYPYGDVEGVKFGKVLEVSKNPNGDKLSVCVIEFDDKNRIIQTTAKNVVVGKTVLAFVPGSRIGDVTFAEKEMKGVVSEGMLSSLEELGVNKEFIRDAYGDEIMFYDVEYLSTDPIEYLGLQDQIIDIDIMSNRSDAQSYYVMARELAAYFKTKIKWPEATKETYISTLKVENGTAKTLAMFEAGNTPKISLKEQILLAKYGLKSINDIVDLTNLSLIMTGQPTHAYDPVVGNNFKANKHTGSFKILGDQEVELENDLVISCDDKPVSIAGVIGGLSSGVNKNTTKDFILEMGIFPINDVRKASKAAKITNHSSLQSSKIISQGTTELAINYLMSKLENHSNVINFKGAKPKTIKYDSKFSSQLAGFDITKEDKWYPTIEALEILGFKFLVDSVEVPAYRHDVETIQDINEEIFRFFGYDSFEPKAPKIGATHITDFRDNKSIIAGQGYQEVTTYSLISKEKNIFNPFELKDVVVLETFVSKEREVIRSSQLYSMLEVIEYNSKRKMEDISIFSEGMIGNGQKSTIIASTTKTFEELKEDINNLLPIDATFVKTDNKTLHPGVSAHIILNDKVIGWIGKAHPLLIKVDAYAAEVLLENPQYIKEAANYSNEPLKSRDVTFEVKVGETISQYIEGVEVYSMKVIDEFAKDNLNKVTVNFRGTEEEIKVIDEKFNK